MRTTTIVEVVGEYYGEESTIRVKAKIAPSATWVDIQDAAAELLPEGFEADYYAPITPLEE